LNLYEKLACRFNRDIRGMTEYILTGNAQFIKEYGIDKIINHLSIIHEMILTKHKKGNQDSD